MAGNGPARGIMNAFCGCAGERCMALPVVVVENAIADQLVAALTKHISQMKLGPAYYKTTDMGPVVNKGSVIYTQNSYYVHTFAKETHGGMMGIYVGIPVPVGIFGFTGQKLSFFGDLYVMGRNGFIFFTESRNVTSTWFTEGVED